MEKRLISELEKGKYKMNEKHFIMSKRKEEPFLPPLPHPRQKKKKKGKTRKEGKEEGREERREVGFVRRIQEPI